MRGTRSRQVDLLNVEAFAGSLIERDSFYAILHEFGPVIIDDEDFSEMYSQKVGRPSLPPSLLAQVLLLQEHDGVSDREAARRVKCDLSWKYALRVPIDYQGFAHANLSHFRARLLVHGLERVSFDKLNELAVKLGVLDPAAPRAMDSSHIFGAAAVQDTYTLLRSSLRKLLAALLERDEAVAEGLIRRHGLAEYMQPGKPLIDWDDPEARAEWLRAIVRDGRQLLEAIDRTSLVDFQVKEAASLLAEILNQDIAEGRGGDPEIRQGVAKGRIISSEDTEMRHGRKSVSKRFDGYKVHVAEDLATEIITDVEVTPGGAHDSEPVADMLEAGAERLGASPSELLGDSHYGSTDLRVLLRERGIEVVAKLPGAAYSNGKRYTKADFAIDLNAEEVTCPAGHTTAKYEMARRKEPPRTALPVCRRHVQCMPP